MIGDRMNDRKQHVVNMAHRLFINKGVQSTSVQDILNIAEFLKRPFIIILHLNTSY